jgi:NhaP-type Na+/H+ and K+/H+ antiporter
VSEIADFGLIVLFVSGIVSLALLSNKVSERFPIPSPAIFLLAAAVTVHFWPSLGRKLSVLDVERLAVVALIVILFDGGVRVGWKRFRVAACRSRCSASSARSRPPPSSPWPAATCSTSVGPGRASSAPRSPRPTRR